MIGTDRRTGPGDGLQPERTALSWSRTSFGVLGNGVLLTLHEVPADRAQLRLLPAGIAAAVALLTYLVGVRRQRLLRTRPLPAGIRGRAEIQLVGWSIILLIVATAVLLPR